MVNRFVHFVGVCTLMIVAVAAILSTVAAPPKSAPTYGSVELKDDASLATKGALSMVLAASQWEITDYGPFSYAKGSILGKPTFDLFGVAGKWYAAKI